MSTTADRMLFHLADPDALAALLAPVPSQRLEMLVESVYDLANSRLHRVDRVTVTDLVLQHPLFPVRRHRGTWSGVVPAHTRSDLSVDRTVTADPCWVDLLATLRVRTVVEADPGGVESVTTDEIEGFSTLDEFRARFRFLDLDGFLAEHSITTVEELREAYHYLRSDIRLRAPPPFDPQSPASVRDLTVTLAVRIHDRFDAGAGLRDAKLVRALAIDVVPARPAPGVGDLIAPYAVAAVFPRAALPDGMTEAEVHEVFGRERVLSLFMDVT